MREKDWPVLAQHKKMSGVITEIVHFWSLSRTMSKESNSRWRMLVGSSSITSLYPQESPYGAAAL